MEYFRILELKHEPFSNSPEPDFLYLSENHRECLQKLELAIRLRRGLNVVLGQVGTGKTTICRQLLIKLQQFNDRDNQFTIQLILDPGFSSPLEFLSAVASGFGVAQEGETGTEWQLKERIKNFLFQRAVEEGKIVLLLIDEGQKLPPYCLEKLREFLNYETNEFKLLQIVIFAQKEFSRLLEDHQNFADRINQLLYLKPLGLRETRKLINHRLALAGAGEAIPSFFSIRSCWTIWRKSAGYPRRIISLCHQIMLALIVSNKKKATPALVKACAAHLPVRRTGRHSLVPVVAVGFVLAVILAGYSLDYDYKQLGKGLLGLKGPEAHVAPITAPQPEILPPVTAAAAPGPPAVALASALPPGETGITPPKAAAPFPVAKKRPELLGVVTIPRRTTLSEVIRRIYGLYTYRRLQEVADYNPGIANVNAIRSGLKIKIPALTGGTAPPRDKPYHVEITSTDDLEEAYQLLHNLPDNLPPVRLFAYRSSKRGKVFALHLKETFADDLSATRALEGLPRHWSAQAEVIDRWDSDTVFFTSF